MTRQEQFEEQRSRTAQIGEAKEQQGPELHGKGMAKAREAKQSKGTAQHRRAKTGKGMAQKYMVTSSKAKEQQGPELN